jgi:hypothetical protein
MRVVSIAADTIAAPLSAEDRFRLRLEEAIRDAADSYPATADPRDALLHAIVELGREGSAFERGARVLVVGSCLETIGAEIQRVGEALLDRAARDAGVVG